MKKLSILILCLTLCNCQLYIDELNRQKGIVKISDQEWVEIKEKYPRYYEDIQNQKISIGMPEECLLLSWGKLKKINKSCYASGCSKQYIYDDAYVYVKNGKVTSWQSN